MKIIDKLKNALFEEEYVEIEEKPKKNKEVKDKNKTVKNRIETIDEEVLDSSKPIAQRIVSKTPKIDSIHTDFNESLRDNNLVEEKKESKIDIINDNDFKMDYQESTSVIDYDKPVGRRSDNYSNNYNNNYNDSYDDSFERIPPVKEEPKLYQASKKESYLDNYTPHEYGNYEKQKEKEKEGFKPSPIISPIYGIVEDTRFMNKTDKTNRNKREVRITTTVSHDKINIEDIRKKAFGNLDDDIMDSKLFKEPEEKEVDKDNILVDLTDSNTPQVSNITVGDAVEYFEDLGLEYNNDYIDSSKVTRTEKNQDLEEKNDEESMNTNKDVVVKEIDDENSTSSESENLFDLIDSMYEE